jgi:glycosyltransferase involved in cell wall biosynthesis
MLAGVPVIASRIGGIEEIVRDRMTGLLVKPNDLDELVGCLRWVLQNPKQVEKMTGRARAYVQEHHSIDQMVSAHVQVFRALMANS